MAVSARPMAAGWLLPVGDRQLGTGSWGPVVGDRLLGTGSWGPAVQWMRIDVDE